MCALSAQTEISILQFGSSLKMNQFEHQLIKETISEYNKFEKEQFKLVFPKMYSVKHIVQFLKASNSTHSIVFNSALKYGTGRKFLEKSDSYLSVTNSLYRIKRDLTDDNDDWKAKYKRVGFMIHTSEEVLFDSLQHVGSFSGVPLKSMEEKKRYLDSGEIDFIIGNEFTSSEYEKILEFPKLIENTISMMFEVNSSLKEKLNPVLKSILGSKKYQLIMDAHFRKKSTDLIEKSYYVFNEPN